MRAEAVWGGCLYVAGNIFRLCEVDVGLTNKMDVSFKALLGIFFSSRVTSGKLSNRERVSEAHFSSQLLAHGSLFISTINCDDDLVVVADVAAELVVAAGALYVVGGGSSEYRLLTPNNRLVMFGGDGMPFAARGWSRKTHPDSR